MVNVSSFSVLELIIDRFSTASMHSSYFSRLAVPKLSETVWRITDDNEYTFSSVDVYSSAWKMKFELEREETETTSKNSTVGKGLMVSVEISKKKRFQFRTPLFQRNSGKTNYSTNLSPKWKFWKKKWRPAILLPQSKAKKRNFLLSILFTVSKQGK